MVRRFSAAVLSVWRDLPPEMREAILAEAAVVWDREYGIKQLPQKLEAFIKRHPSRLE